MTYTPTSILSGLQTNPSIIRDYWLSQKTQFRTDLGPEFSLQCDAHLALALCCVVAFEYRPYGGSLARTLSSLLTQQVLDCDNYVTLAWELYYLIYPLGPTKVSAVGWDGGAIGNHAQLQAVTPGSPDIYLDPTIGLCVHGFRFSALCAPITVQPRWMKSFWDYSPKPNIATFEAKVKDAMQQAKFKTDDILYVVPGIDMWRGQV